MAKSEQPVIYVKRRGNQLFPEMQADADLIQRLSADTRIKITVTEGRSPAKLRLYWAYLGRVVKACECAPSPEALHDVVKLHTGFVTPVMVKGFTVAVPKSISFSSMSESEFDDFLRTAEKWLIETYGISISDAFEEAAA
jgi:hypothetical protein